MGQLFKHIFVFDWGVTLDDKAVRPSLAAVVRAEGDGDLDAGGTLVFASARLPCQCCWKPVFFFLSPALGRILVEGMFLVEYCRFGTGNKDQRVMTMAPCDLGASFVRRNGNGNGCIASRCLSWVST